MPAFFSAAGSSRPSDMGFIAHGRYQVGQKIGAGAFGTVHEGTDMESGEQVAVKSEPSGTKKTILLAEARIYKSLAGKRGFPTLRHCGMEAHQNVLVTDLLGFSLEQLLRRGQRIFSLKTCLMLGDQLLERLESLHECGYLHRDLKPQNVLMGCRGEDVQLPHVIDFGLSKRFRDSQTSQHISYRENKPLVGTPAFASSRASRGCEQGRRDDLEALGYMLVYFLNGSLPWMGICTNTRSAKNLLIAQMKASTSIQQLCAGLEGEATLIEYFTYCRGLAFQECPDYAYLRQLLTDAMHAKGYEFDFAYDWSCPRTRPATDES